MSITLLRSSKSSLRPTHSLSPHHRELGDQERHVVSSSNHPHHSHKSSSTPYLIPSFRSAHSAPPLHYHLPAPPSPAASSSPAQRRNQTYTAKLSSPACDVPQRAGRFCTWARGSRC